MGGYISYFYNKPENKTEQEQEQEREQEQKHEITEEDDIVIADNNPQQPKRKYLWKRQKHDSRDKHNFFYIDVNKDTIDLRSNCPEVYNQGDIGSCTANAICGAYEYDYMKKYKKDNFKPSRLFLYYNERDMENSVHSDSGAQIRDGMKSINKVGVCSEDEWSYDTSKFADKPSEQCYKDAITHESIFYGSLKQTLDQLQSCLLSGLPFVFGFAVYKSFETKEVAKTGIMIMPTENDTQLGGHAVMAVGYDNKKKVFIIRNSWGSKWGDKGYFYMPYDYILDNKLCSDFWVMKTVK